MRKSCWCCVLWALAWDKRAHQRRKSAPPTEPWPCPIPRPKTSFPARRHASSNRHRRLQTQTGAAKPAAAGAKTAASDAKTPAADCKTVITKAEFERLASGVAPNMTPT